MQPAIEIEQMTKDYPGVKALDEISFTVKRGSIHGFLGPNGAGKSTTMRILSGFTKASKGRVQVLGENPQEALNQARTKVGYLPENPPLYADMQVQEYLNYVADLKRIPRTERDTAVKDAMAAAQLHDVHERLIGNLSKGYRQRVGVAQALVHKPELLILDEPTAGLDPAAIREMRQLILDLKGKHTLLISTHLLHEVTMICSDITVINKGKIVTSGSIDEVQHNFDRVPTLVAKLEHWDDGQALKYQDLEFVVGIRSQKLADSTQVEFQMRDFSDYRSELSRMLVADELGLLSFEQKEWDLEKTFLKMIERETQS